MIHDRGLWVLGGLRRSCVFGNFASVCEKFVVGNLCHLVSNRSGLLRIEIYHEMGENWS